MSQMEKNTIQQLATLIMSSNLSDEVQQEALHCLKPYPDVVLSLLKKSCGNDEELSQKSTNEQNQKSTNEKSQKSTNEQGQKSTNEQSQKSTNEQGQKSTNEQSQKSTNEQSQKSTNEQSQNLTNEQGQKSTNEQSQKSTNEQGQKSTNEQSQKSTNEQSQKSTNEQSQNLTNEQGQKSTNEQNQKSPNGCHHSIHENSITNGYEHSIHDDSPFKGGNHSMHNKSAKQRSENNSHDQKEEGGSNKNLNNVQIFNSFGNVSRKQSDSDDKQKSKDLDEEEKWLKKVSIGGSGMADQNESRPKKRKSKYSDIHGDLSHIWREPKCKTSKRQTKKRKYTKRKDGGEKQNDDAEKQKDIKLVKKLIETIKHPKSRQHQECILTLLRRNGDLRKLFLEEKAKMGKQTIQVFRRSSSNDDSKYFSNGSEYQNPSTRAPIVDQRLHDLHNNGLCDLSEINIPEMHSDDPDDLINAFIQSFGNGICKPSVQDPLSNEARMVFPLQTQNCEMNRGEVNASTTRGTSKDCNGTANILYMEPTINDDTSMAFYEENPALSFFVNEGQPPSTTTLLTHTDTDNSLAQNDCVFDASFHDDLQNTSEELYYTNNVQPNNNLGWLFDWLI